jgi:predicted RNA-binding protein with PUA-like domain
MAATDKRPRFWLMKTEPDTFSFDDLVKAKGRTTSWEGVRNYQARNLLRDELKLGDQVFIYHSSCDEPAVIGIGEVVRENHPDLSALDKKSLYFDEKSLKDGASRWCLVDVRAVARLANPVPLKALREIKGLEDMMVIKRGARLSVQPVSAAEWKIITKVGKPEPL